jgi:hypothetical protein
MTYRTASSRACSSQANDVRVVLQLQAVDFETPRLTELAQTPRELAGTTDGTAWHLALYDGIHVCKIDATKTQQKRVPK